MIAERGDAAQGQPKRAIAGDRGVFIFGPRQTPVKDS
jgi:hypothetical protein